MGSVFIELLKLLTIDLIFVGILLIVLVPLAAYKKAAYAVLKRNFVGYFSNPTGYVFLCLFVFLTSAAAFWPHDFFIANLANLDQLNKYIPLILLIFVPAITMSIWAEERRQGTDELLLTLPAADFDIVIGKYLAAAAIFTVSLIFSQLANYMVLVSLAREPDASVVDIDTGLFFTTYFGYWLMGLAMLSIGMVASFLTNNLTVSFILGMLLCAIPVAPYYADVLVPASSMAQRISQWSFAAQFDDFGRGVISLSSVAFFVLIIALGIYLSMVLIGKRHWMRHDAARTSSAQTSLSLVGLLLTVVGLACLILAPVLAKDSAMIALVVGLASAAAGAGLYWYSGQLVSPPNSGSMVAHYVMRTLALIALLIGVNTLLKRYDVLRPDLTKGQVSSLSPDTKKLLREVAGQDKRPIIIDAYISASVPEEFVKVRYNLISTLKELERQAGSRVHVNLYDDLEPFSEQAAQAEERFGIRRQTVVTQSRGAMKEEEFIMGVAFTCGLEKVVVPSLGLGTPVEYELVRSIATVSGGQRKRLGVVNTDAQMRGGFTMQGMQPRQLEKQLIMEELEKQYKVEDVDPSNPIDPGKYDVLLVVQPSSLGPPQLANVVDAIKKGQPAAVFEDPFPFVMPQTVGTAQEKQAQGMFGMGGPPPQKGDIRALWNALGIQVTGDEGDRAPVPAEVVWQDFNPYPRFQGRGIGPELVFVREDAPGTKNGFNAEKPVCANFEELLLPYATGISQKSGTDLKFTELVTTSSTLSGTVEVNDLQMSQFDPYLLAEKRGRPTGRKYVLAAWIQGAVGEGTKATTAEGTGKLEVKNTSADAEDAAKATPAAGKAAGGTAAADSKEKSVNVIYVGDIDLLSSEFVRIRNSPNTLLEKFRFDNVPFVLNVIDAVAGDMRFLEIRKRKPRHSTLRMVENQATEARKREADKVAEFTAKYNAEVKKADEEAAKFSADAQKIMDDLRRRQAQGEEIDPAEVEAKAADLNWRKAWADRRAEVAKEGLRRERDKNLKAIERQRDQQIQQIQNDYKLRATLFPPIPPLLVGLVVWARRRIREREGISRTRMRTS